jgi:hypothetical protein
LIFCGAVGTGSHIGRTNYLCKHFFMIVPSPS